MPEATLSMTASALRPQLQASLLQKLNATSAGKKNLLQKGFTLVELMIVIVIVGILSAIALPNFLSQSDKAKLTEAKQQSSAYLKQAFAEFQEQGTAGINTNSVDASSNPGICPATGTYFEYTCNTPTTTSATISAKGTAAAGTLSGKTVTGTVTFATGKITISDPA